MIALASSHGVAARVRPSPPLTLSPCAVLQFSDKAARRRAFHVLPSAAYAAAVMEGINVSRKLAKQAELETEADELGLTSKQRADRLRQHKYVGGPSTSRYRTRFYCCV